MNLSNRRTSATSVTTDTRAHRSKRVVQAMTALAFFGTVLFVPHACAATANTTFQVNATVISACTVSGSLLNFGSAIDPLTTGVPLDASAAMTVQCTNTTPYSVALSAGLNAGGAANFSNRSMKNGSNTLAYQLYVDAARASVWGDGTGGSAPVTGTGTGSSQTLTIYGRIPSLTGTVPGTYTDTVTVTVNY